MANECWNWKDQIFRCARKRGLSPEQVREMLRARGAPPTLSEKPMQHQVVEGYENPFHFFPMPYRERVEGDYRDVTKQLRDELVDHLVKNYPVKR